MSHESHIGNPSSRYIDGQWSRATSLDGGLDISGEIESGVDEWVPGVVRILIVSRENDLRGNNHAGVSSP